MEELKSIFEHPEIIKSIGETGVKEIVMRSLKWHYAFRNMQRLFGILLSLPFFTLCYISIFYAKYEIKDWVWWGCVLSLTVGLSFFFPKQAEPIFNAFMKKMGVQPEKKQEDEVK